MNILLINGSPKASGSASGLLLEELRGYLQGHTVSSFTWNVKSKLADLDGSPFFHQDALVFAFPLYVDGIPSHLLRLLVELEQQNTGEKSGCTVFGIVNAGFYEGRQCVNALDILRVWSEKAGMRWGRGVGIGGGGMVAGLTNVPPGKGPRKNFSDALTQIASSVEQGTNGENLFVSPNIPRFVYLSAGNMGWPMQAKQNGLKKKELSVRI